MGYGIMPYRVNLDRVTSLIGTSKEHVREDVKSYCSRRASRIDSLSSSGENDPKFMDIVEELLDGKATHKHYGFMYWYAIEDFIKMCGTMMVNTELVSVRAGDMDFFFRKFKMNNHFRSPLTFSIPTPDEFPTVLVKLSSEIDEFLMTTFKEAPLKFPQFSETEYEQIQSWLVEAKQNEQDLVLYYY